MPHPDETIAGTVIHLFGHRFVVETDAGAVLADLTPHGAASITLAIGDRLSFTGERKPTEIKVARLTRDGTTTTIDHPDAKSIDLDAVLRAVRDAGYTPIGTPLRKPKHVEVLAKRGSKTEELHVDAGGYIRHAKGGDAKEPKWRTDHA